MRARSDAESRREGGIDLPQNSHDARRRLYNGRLQAGQVKVRTASSVKGKVVWLRTGIIPPQC